MSGFVFSIGLGVIRTSISSAGTAATGQGIGLAWTAALGGSVIGQISAAQNLDTKTVINIPILGTDISVNNGVVGYVGTTVGTLAMMGQVAAGAAGAVALAGTLGSVALGAAIVAGAFNPDARAMIGALAASLSKRLSDAAASIPNFPQGDPFTGMPWPGGDPGDWDDAEHTVSPLVLDLDGDGVETTQLSRSMTSGTHFNLDARGLSENTGWAGGDDGLLVRDLNGDGKITSGRELFGNHTLLKNGAEAANGFEALRDLDDNADGLIDSRDAAFASLRVWRDANQDGITDAGELLTLDAAGVRNLKVAYTAGGTDAQGNAHSQLGGYTKTDGSTQQMDDVWFAVDTVRSVNRDPVAVDANYLNVANDKDWRAAA